jgi:hypothetical protein
MVPCGKPGTFFLTHQTPCSFCLSKMLTSVVYTTSVGSASSAAGLTGQLEGPVLQAAPIG